MMHFYFLKRISLSLFILPAFMWAQDCDMLPLNLNGLNADVIAEGTGGDADGKSTHSIDADSWFSCIYYAEDFVPLNPDNYPSAEDFGGGLPNDGFLTSASSGIEYQFADYTGNNAVLLRNSVTNSVTVSSDAPFAAEALYLAVLSSEGVHNVNVTINFADGSSQNSSFQAMDWYQTFPPSNYIYYGLGRLSRGTGTGAPLNAFLDFGIMTIFEHTISIDAENVGKEITTIDFDKELTGNNAATTVVFAITACEVPIIGGEDPCEDKTIMECGETYTHELIPDAGIWTNYTGVTWNYTGSEKVWEFTAPTTGEYIFEVDAGTQDADFFLMDACSNTANNLITNTLGYWTGDNPNETITLTEGVTYYLIADLYTSASSPTTVSVKVTCPDDEPDPEGPCEDKTIMECGETYTQELIPDAGVWTNYTGVTWNYTGSEKVWEFTAPTTGEYIFEVDAGTQDADFFLMDACSNTANNLITNALGYWTGDNPSETITLTEGVTYYLIADLYTSASSPTTVSAKVTCPDDEPDPEDEYCEPVLDCTDGDLITNVTFEEINNDSECSPNGYADYTDQMANVEAGETYEMSVTVGGGWDFESVSVWIDYDNSFTFDEDEFTYLGTGTASDVVGIITIPEGVVDGEYRMRVRVAAVGEGTATWDMACDETQVYGETEDYTVNVGELGLSDVNGFSFTYYPNPVKDVLNISSKKSIENVSVFNLAGQKVLGNAKVSNNQVDVNSLTPGTYVFKVTLEGGQAETFKIIKK